MSRITPRSKKNNQLSINKTLNSQSTYEISYGESEEKVEEIILVSIDRST